MPLITVHVFQSELDAAAMIARKMLPEKPDYIKPESVIRTAVTFGLAELCKIWNEETSSSSEDAANAYADAKIRQHKLEREGDAHDMTPDGMPLGEGS